MTTTAFLDAEHYLPHAAPMVLIEKVLAVSEQGASCQVRVSADGVLAPFLDAQGQLPAWFAMELMAQTVGVWNGWHAGQRGSAPRLGMLLGGRGLSCSLAAFPADALLTINVNMVLQDEKLASFECAITHEDSLQASDQGRETIVAHARLNTYQPEPEELKKLTQGISK
jgi:predicted hotdog family 3-hydroxylacyl-ACP dehydratase